MTDTPGHIKELQLDLWLSKTPEERLYQYLVDSDALWNALRRAKIAMSIPLNDPASNEEHPKAGTANL